MLLNIVLIENITFYVKKSHDCQTKSFFSHQTELLRSNLRDKIQLTELYDIYDKPTFNHNQTGQSILLDSVRLVKENATLAVSGIDAALYFIRPAQSDEALKGLIDTFEFFEHLRWPVTLGFFTFLLFLCTVLVIGVARSSRCLLIFFSVLGLLSVAICWLLAGIYLASSVAIGDFCMQPYQHVCHQQKLQYIYYTNCGASGTNHFVIRLNGSKDNVDRAKDALETVAKISKDLYRNSDATDKINQISKLLDTSKNVLSGKFIYLLVKEIFSDSYNLTFRTLNEPGQPSNSRTLLKR